MSRPRVLPNNNRRSNNINTRQVPAFNPFNLLKIPSIRKPSIHFSDNYKNIDIVYPNGKRISVKNGVINDVDDHVTRKAFDISKLNQTSHLPRSIYCPITNFPMTDPVICSDGYSYDRISIEKWLQKKMTSPYTGADLPNSNLIPNHALRNTISELLQS